MVHAGRQAEELVAHVLVVLVVALVLLVRVDDDLGRALVAIVQPAWRTKKGESHTARGGWSMKQR